MAKVKLAKFFLCVGFAFVLSFLFFVFQVMLENLKYYFVGPFFVFK